jgi:hypothetical protein
LNSNNEPHLQKALADAVTLTEDFAREWLFEKLKKMTIKKTPPKIWERLYLSQAILIQKI